MKCKTIKIATLAFILFKASVVAYNVYNLIPKFDTFEGIDSNKLIENVNSRFAEN